MIKITIVSTKGGTGKTTLTANLGALLADMGLRTLVIDADPQPSVSKFYPLSRTAPNGLVELLLGDSADSNLISNTLIQTWISCCRIIPHLIFKHSFKLVQIAPSYFATNSSIPTQYHSSTN